ncbi:Tyrosine recombinase XerC [subsurface metagenome]
MRSSPPPTLEGADCERILDALRSNSGTLKKTLLSVRNHCMALLMLEAGLRVGELVSLRMSDLYFNSVPVRNIIIKPHMTKNKVEHEIPVSDRLSESLCSYLNTCFRWDDVRGSDFAFTNVSTDRPITARQVERIICAAGWKALGRPVNPHMFRHTAGSKWMRVTNSSTVQHMLGHKYLTSTQVYCHPNADDKRQAIKQASLPVPPDQHSQQETEKPAEPANPSNPGPVPASPLFSPEKSRW